MTEATTAPQPTPIRVEVHRTGPEGRGWEEIAAYTEVVEARRAIPHLDNGTYRIIRVVQDGIQLKDPAVPTKKAVDWGHTYLQKPGARGKRSPKPKGGTKK